MPTDHTPASTRRPKALLRKSARPRDTAAKAVQSEAVPSATQQPAIVATCDDVAELLPAVELTEMLPDAERGHLQQCLRCQAEAVGYRRLRRGLASLAQQRAVPGPSSVAMAPDIVVLAEHARGRIGRALADGADRAGRAGKRAGSALAHGEAALVGTAAAVASGVAIAAATRRALRVRYRLSTC